MRLEPYVTPYNASRTALRWSSSKPDVATVDSGGYVTGLKAGTSKITVSSENGMIFAECTVTVKSDTRRVQSISLNATAITLNAGATRTLTVRYTPSNATIKGVTWSSNSSAVARVEPNGRITAVSAGTATITARSDSGAFLAQCVVTVVIPVASITLPETSITLKVGSTYQLYPIINPPDATDTTAKYSTRSAAIASVSAEGLITARRTGTTTITVTIGGKTVTCSVRVVA